MKNRLLLPLLSVLVSASVCAQSGPVSQSTTSTGTTGPCGFYCWWSVQTNATQSKQPSWAVPLLTTYTGLFQVVRFDALRQIAPARTDTWNYDNSKGLNVIIPHTPVEVDVDLPPYIEHNTKAKDGAGDFSVLGKWRLASGNAQHGAYVLSAWALVTFPTGSYKNGSPNPSVAPTLGFGKGFGNFDVQSTLGITLPTGGAAVNTSGRPIAWNTAAQYKIAKIFWPEIESNATFFQNGTNNGKMQEFITPGILIGKCGIHPKDPKSRPGLAFGTGMQIATSQFHTYNHELVMTVRWIY